ncbi:MAG: acyl-CoA thioesterase [Minwuia sp.]|uniref:acyl-CoA thioesterase n=1 Tax=Minwuia sp. TaxID=2493630 RepID=UPI003A891FA7
MNEPDPTDRASYWRWVKAMTRFCDTDANGHVNNTVYGQFIEAGRVRLITQMMPEANIANPWVVARVEIDFLGELTFPSELDVGTRVVRVGNTSYTVISGVFEGERCVAKGRTVLVHAVGGKSVPPPAAEKALIEAELLGPSGVDSPVGRV